MKNLKLLEIKFGKHFIEDQAEGNDIISFGYYNSIEFESIDTWHKFRPGNSLETKTTLDDYTLRLVCPKDLVEIQRKNYSFWDNPKKSTSQSASEPAFISCCLINISDAYFRSKKNLNWENYSAEIFNILNNLIIDNTGKKENLFHAIYFGLGYTDIVILLKSDNIQKLADCVSAVRAITYCSDENEKFLMVSSSYTIFGLINGNDSNKNQSKINVTFDFSLSVSNTQKEVEALLENSPLKEANLFSIFGGQEWRIIADLTFNDFCSLYKDDGIFAQTKSTVFKSLNTNFTFEKNLEDLSLDVISPTKIPETRKGWDRLFENFQLNYQRLESTHSIHRRSYYAMVQLKQTYEKLIHTTHGYEVDTTIGEFFAGFLHALNAYMSIMCGDALEDVNNNFDCTLSESHYKELCQIFQTEIPDGYKFKYSEFIEEEIEKFRRIISFLLFDIWRSDQPFFEGQTISHPSIGSTTKLLFAYDKIIDRWDKDYREWFKDHNPDKKITDSIFLVTSGGFDETSTFHYFEKLNDIRHELERPGIVIIPEASLYDFKGTLFRMAHEFFHVRGIRKRRERYDYYVNDLREALSHRLVHVTIEFLKNTLGQDGIFVDSSLNQKHDKAIELYQKILELLKFGVPENINVYGPKVYTEGGKILNETAKSQKTQILEVCSAFCISCYAQLNISSDLPFNKTDFIFSKEGQPLLSYTLNHVIQEKISSFFQCRDKNASEIESGSEYDSYIIPVYFYLYKECYADCLAARALGLSFTEYILCFLFEHRGIDDFFGIKENEEEIIMDKYKALRFEIVHEVCFNDSDFMCDDSSLKAFNKILFGSDKRKSGNRRNQLVTRCKKALENMKQLIDREKESGLFYPHHLIKYLKDCLNENEEFLSRGFEVYRKIKYFDHDSYFNIMMDGWLQNYKEINLRALK